METLAASSPTAFATPSAIARRLVRYVRRWNRRARLVEIARWGLRALVLGLGFGCSLAFGARLHPWLLPEQVVQLSVTFTLALLLGTLGAVWVRLPRGLLPQARYFDRRFRLAERVSTALELEQRGGVPPQVGTRQLTDALRAAERVNVRAQLPLRVRKAEIFALLGLSGLFAALLLLPNPQADALRATQVWQQTLSAQAAALNAQIEAIGADEALSEAAQQALTAPLQQAASTLSQEGITPQEAVAALAEAQQALQELADGMPPDAQQAYQDAAQALAGAEPSTSLAQALQEANLGAAADALETLAEEAGTLSEAEREQLAEGLDAAADALEAQNPALAQQFRQAAQALREGDPAAAHQALQQTAALAEQQNAALQQSALAQEAQAATQTLQASMQTLTQAGQPSPATDAQRGEESLSTNGASSQQSTGSAQQTQQPSAEGAEPAEGVGAGVQQAGASEGENGREEATTAQGSVETGAPSLSSAEGDLQNYTPQNPSTALGGEGEQNMTLDVQGETSPEGSHEVIVGAPTDQAASVLTYSEVLRRHQQAINAALSNARIPLDQRDVIHDYFTSLSQQP